MKSAVPLSRTERRKQGKALRDKCPRTAQAEWKPRSKSTDIVELLEESDADRIPGLIPVKYQRMSVSPFTFYRGAAIIQARDLANARVSGITVQACGDCHLMNFGGFASPERAAGVRHQRLRRDVSRSMGMGRETLGREPRSCGQGPELLQGCGGRCSASGRCDLRERMAEFAEMKVLDTWYAQVTSRLSQEHFRKDKDMLARLLKKQKQARSQTSEAVIPKLTAVVDGRRQDQGQSPGHLPFPAKCRRISRSAVRTTVELYREILAGRSTRLVRSLSFPGFRGQSCRCGQRRNALLPVNCFSPMTMIRSSCNPRKRADRCWNRHAARAASPIRASGLCQGSVSCRRASDIFLGWFRSANGHDYYVRQFRDMKVSAEVETFKPSTLVSYATLCGWALARAHAKSGDAAMIAGYLGSTNQFDEALVKYSRAYADQAERDYETFQAAVRSGRLSTEPAKGAGLEFLQ